MKPCPSCGRLCAAVKIDIFDEAENRVINHLKGLLCSNCRTIWSQTKINDSVDLRVLT